MELRKEKNEKSKELIRKQFKSDILNISTGYYKTEKILPITAKPTESKEKINEFIPKYKEMTPSKRLFNELLSHQQKRNLSIKEIRPNLTRQNSEVQTFRHYNKTIKENCFDEKGNFSAKKRYRLEFYGKDNINNNKTLNKSFHSTIKDKRNKSLKNLLANNLFIQKDSGNTKERTNSCKNVYMNYQNNKYQLQIPGKSKKNNLSTFNFKCPQNDLKGNTSNINKIDKKLSQQTSPKSSNTKITNEKLNYGHRKVIENEFYTKVTQPIKSNRISIKEKENDEKDYYDIEIKKNDTNNKGPFVDQKKLKQIFLKNGLHLYDFNEDGMNDIFTDKKFEAKLRKNKEDVNFDKNYRNVVRELNKINVKVNRCGIVNDTGFLNKNVQRKRKGTPGKNLKKNKENKDENTKLNTGFAFKRDKYIQPQQNKEYKNGYNYKMNYFNHNKK